MDLKNVLFEVVDGGVAVVTVNRPEKLNALNAQTMADLRAAFERIRDDAEIGAAVLTGAGEKAFIAGADIGELAERTGISGKQMAGKGQAILDLIERLGKATVAAINGWALGGGLEIAMACPMRVAAKGARMGQPEVNLGVIPGYGGTQRLPRLIGRARAVEMVLTGEPIDADEAWRIGLVNKVVEKEALRDAAIELARKTTKAKVGPLAVRYALEAIDRGLSTSLEEGLRIEADLFGALCETSDMREGTKAFLEKRKPEFKGE